MTRYGKSGNSIFTGPKEELQAALGYKHHESEITNRLELNETPLP